MMLKPRGVLNLEDRKGEKNYFQYTVATPNELIKLPNRCPVSKGSTPISQVASDERL
jgi:hypothetical protein